MYYEAARKMDMTKEELVFFIVKEQSRELTSAEALAIDLELAFNIQMQEAITASLPPQSTSILPPPPPLPILNQFEQGSVAADDYLASVIAEEIARYEQEKSDRRQAEEEMFRFKEEIGRVVHDRRFAQQLNLVPEKQWQKTGDHIKKPYGDGASSSRSTAPIPNNNELFKLYTKGFLSKWAGIGTAFAGIGIALCDIENNVLFRMAKPAVGVKMISIEVELNALAEGLNIALELGIKHVSLFTDNFQLHGYLEGNLKPRRENATSLVDQVTLLFRKFSFCTSVLVDPKDVKISVKLAREAIDSQIAREPEKVKSAKLNSVNCSICMEDIDHFRMYYIEGCLHSYCLCCMKLYVEGQLFNGILPKCPHEGCESSLTLDSCKEFLPPRTYDILKERVHEASIPATNRIYCPNPKCSELMSQSGDIANVAMECVKCGLLFCGQCKVPWHNNMSCDTYTKLYPNQGDAKLKSVAARKKWRQCVKCKTMVELADGCYHISCRCGHEFCYTCGAEWEKKAATCRCPLWDEKNIVRLR